MAKKNGIQDFIDAQNRQYTPWEYTVRGEPTPWQKGEVNPKLLAIYNYIGAVVLFVLLMGIGVLTGQLEVYFLGVAIPMFFFLLGRGYHRKHKMLSSTNHHRHYHDKKKKKRRKNK